MLRTRYIVLRSCGQDGREERGGIPELPLHWWAESNYMWCGRSRT